jgi:hypothetical protein
MGSAVSILKRHLVKEIAHQTSPLPQADCWILTNENAKENEYRLLALCFIDYADLIENIEK